MFEGAVEASVVPLFSAVFTSTSTISACKLGFGQQRLCLDLSVIRSPLCK
jgi:hypothetical protein